MIIINVTQDDIDNGVLMRCCVCPVARAMDKAFGLEIPITGFPKRTCFMIDKHSIDLWSISEPLIRIDTPIDTRLFITQFDAQQPVKPFSFIIDETLFLPWIKPVTI